MSGKRSQEPGNGITGSAAEARMGRYSCVRRDTGDRDRKKHFCQTRFRLISGVMKQHGSRKRQSCTEMYVAVFIIKSGMSVD